MHLSKHALTSPLDGALWGNSPPTRTIGVLTEPKIQGSIEINVPALGEQDFLKGLKHGDQRADKNETASELLYG